MSDWWDGQLDSLQTLAEIFYHLTYAELGGIKDHPIYEEFRACRLQLRLAKDFVLYPIFISKDKKLYGRDRTVMVRHGNLGNHLWELDYRTVESVARYTSEEDGSKPRTLTMGGLLSIAELCHGYVMGRARLSRESM
ncbi:MAG: hypothetical protein M1835_003553, partial [Candelina submexicana]